MRIRLLAVNILMLFSAAVAPAAEEVLDGIAAVVNKDVITFSQVRELVAMQERSLRESLKGQELMDKVKNLRLAAINDLIDRQLVLQEFEKNKFNIPDYIIDDHINTIIRTQFNGDRQAFIRTLAAQGYTLQRFRKIEVDKMVVQAMRSRAVKSNPIISPSKLESFYNLNRAEYTTQEEIKLRMIVLRGENPDAKGMAEELRTKIQKGADFTKMAQMYSEDSSKEVGGDWGWVDRKTLNEKLTAAAFALKAGQVSKPVELGDNYYLLFVEARKNAETKPLSAVRDEVSKKVLQSERQAAQQKWIQDLRSKAYVKIY